MSCPSHAWDSDCRMTDAEPEIDETRVAPPPSDTDAMDDICRILSDTAHWSPVTLDAIAAVVWETGRTITENTP